MPYTMYIYPKMDDDMPAAGDLFVVDGVHSDRNDVMRVELTPSAADIPPEAMLGCSDPQIAKLLLRLPNADTVTISIPVDGWELPSGEIVLVRKYAFIMTLGVSEDASTIVVYRPEVAE